MESARYLYVCEHGLVHWCSQQRGHPGIPLDEYTPGHLEAEYHRIKSCAPLCTVGCVRRVAQVDELRHDPERALMEWFESPVQHQPLAMPMAVRFLRRAFVTSAHRESFRRIAAGLFGANRWS